MDIKPNTQMQTRSGKTVHIIVIDENDDCGYPVVGAFQDDDGAWKIDYWAEDGAFLRGTKSDNDFMHPLYEGYLLIDTDESHDGEIYESEKNAAEHRVPRERIVHIREVRD